MGGEGVSGNADCLLNCTVVFTMPVMHPYTVISIMNTIKQISNMNWTPTMTQGSLKHYSVKR
jgi:hypothetical protein